MYIWQGTRDQWMIVFFVMSACVAATGVQYALFGSGSIFFEVFTDINCLSTVEVQPWALPPSEPKPDEIVKENGDHSKY